MTPTTTKTLFPLDQSLHPTTASLLDNDGSANIPRGFSANDRHGGAVSGASAGTLMTGGMRKRWAAPSGGVVCCTLFACCCAACARTCSTGSISNNPARTMERALRIAAPFLHRRLGGRAAGYQQGDVTLREGEAQTGVYSTITHLTVALQNGTGNCPTRSVSTSNSSCRCIIPRNQSWAWPAPQAFRVEGSKTARESSRTLRHEI